MTFTRFACIGARRKAITWWSQKIREARKKSSNLSVNLTLSMLPVMCI